MAKIYGQLEKAQLENTTSDTASHPKGMVTYRTDLNQVKVSNGTTYKLLIDEDSTQTLSNKTYANPLITGAITSAQTTTPANPASGENKLYFKADGKLYTLDSSGNEAIVGSGTGGVKNLITNGNADDTSSSIFVPYADAASTRPVDGTGGSPTVTTSMTTSTPLDGTKSFLLTKPASNVQGQGWSVPFTVDPAYRAKSLKISFDYIVNSGTFVAGGTGVESDVILYIYDVTNSQLIEPSNIKILSNSTTLSDKFEATFQSSATGSSYRLIAHVQSVSALAYELKVDNITVSPQTYVFGTPVTDWVAYTPTLSNITLGNGTLAAFYRRVGDSIEINFSFKMGTTSSMGTSPSFSLPNGLTFDSNKFTAPNGEQTIGYGKIYDAGTDAFDAIAEVSGNNILVRVIKRAGADYLDFPHIQSTVPMTWANGDAITIRTGLVPISGWSSSVQMSDSADTRVVSAVVSRASSQSLTAALTKVAYNSVNYDSHNLFDTTNNRYLVSVAGEYEFSAMFSFSTSSSSGVADCFLYKNGSAVANRQQYIPISSATLSGGSVTFKDKAVAGDYYEIFLTPQFTVTLNTSSLNIMRLSGPSAVAANEDITARYSTDSGQSIPNASFTIINFEDKTFDSHGSVTVGANWKFQPNCSGEFEVSGLIIFSSGGGWAAGEAVSIDLYKNGGSYSRVGGLHMQATNSTYVIVPIAAEAIKLTSSDYIDIRIYQDSGATLTLHNNGATNWISIKRVGRF